MVTYQLYDRIGTGYRDFRRADPRIMATILNVKSRRIATPPKAEASH
jgi:hypothetical protein